MASKRVRTGPSSAISDVPLERRKELARYATSPKTAQRDAEKFDAMCAEMRARALAGRRK